MPGLAGVGFQLGLQVFDEQDAVLVLAEETAEEREEVGAEALLDLADDLAAAVVGDRTEIDEVVVLSMGWTVGWMSPRARAPR